MDRRGIDALLDEVGEARLKIMAQHGNDWRKVLDHYLELARQRRSAVIDVPEVQDERAA